MIDNNQHRLSVCMITICDQATSRNAVAWFELHKAGLTVAALRDAAEDPDWRGPKPRFEDAPAVGSPIWLAMERAEAK